MSGENRNESGRLGRGRGFKHALTGMLSAAGILCGAALAVEVDGVRIPDRAVVGKTELVLNGAGMRHKLMAVPVYVGALYLTARKKSAAEVLADAGPKRILMHVVIEELTARELTASLNDAIEANHIPAEITLIQKRLTDLNRMMNSIGILKRGGIVTIDFLPRTGTRITVEGVERITIPGNDFFRSLLKIWIGAKPVDGRLRAALLGGS
ncbi:MAG: hypothetical protein A3I02_00580 [Betaproteobacteria bacterium RIFCSPLOWO2_02_FULL_67_26]|nr:MAG: hypothetical protein A3I02_00580 [Betaproteobacteria bacterium RIFCSPLOWO2_02_FULL_67_26]